MQLVISFFQDASYDMIKNVAIQPIIQLRNLEKPSVAHSSPEEDPLLLKVLLEKGI